MSNLRKYLTKLDISQLKQCIYDLGYVVESQKNKKIIDLRRAIPVLTEEEEEISYNNINDVEEAETFDYLYNFHNNSARSDTQITLYNINILKLFKLIEEKPHFALPIFLWIDTFHDFRKTRFLCQSLRRL